MDGQKSKPVVAERDDHDHDQDQKGSMRKAESILRLAPVGFCISALVVMLKNSQTNDFGSLSYSDLSAFRYLVHANGICAGYALLSAVVVAMPRRPSTMSSAWTFFLLDQVFTYLILGAASVSTEVLYLAKNGDIDITWSAVCGSFGGFCHKAAVSVVLTFVVVALFALLSLVSSYKLFSRFDAPLVTCPASKAAGLEISAF
ncbi:CASP-like protein 2A1 [Linum grandiflorum]